MASFGSATLELKGPKGTTTVELNGARVSVGRAPGNDVLLNDTATSNAHCEFVKEGDGLVIRDLGSSNGTYVNGRRVQAVKLFDGDLVRIGQWEGTIDVRQPSGRRLDAPGGGSPVFSVFAALFAVLLIGAGAWEFTLFQNVRKERALFAEFEQRAQELLQTRTPCAVARARLPKLVEPLTVPPLGKPGKPSTDELEVVRQFTQTQATPREQFLKDLVTDLESGPVATDRLQRQRALKAYEGQFKDPALVSAYQSFQKAIVDQIKAGDDLREALHKQQESVAHLTEPLRRFLQKPDDRSAANDIAAAAPALPTAAVATESIGKCEASFEQTATAALVTLAGVQL